MKYFALMALFYLLSCGPGTANTEPPASDSARPDGTEVDTINTPPDTTRNMGVNTRPPEGVYQALLPCPDCKGIQHTVAFSPDLSYRLEEERFGKGAPPTQTSGNWKPENGTIRLYKDGQVIGQYRWKGDTLLYVTDTQTFATYKLTPASENKTWNRKKAEGVEFFGVGNEPFWNIEIDEGKGISFHLAEWQQPIRFRAAKPLLATDSTVYITGNDTARLQVTIYPFFCSDGMSDYVYEHRVKVAYRNQVYQGCGIRFGGK